MVIHQAKDMDERTELFMSVPEDLEEKIAIIGAEKYRLLLIPPGIDMIKSPWELDP